MATLSRLPIGSQGGPLPYLPRPGSLGLPAFAGPVIPPGMRSAASGLYRARVA